MACSWFIPCSFFHLSMTLILTAAASSLIHASRLFSSSSFCRLSEPLLKLRLSVPSRKLERFLSAVPGRSATEPVPGANVLAEFCTRARSRVMGNTWDISGKVAWELWSPRRYWSLRAARNWSVSSGAGYWPRMTASWACRRHTERKCYTDFKDSWSVRTWGKQHERTKF